MPSSAGPAPRPSLARNDVLSWGRAHRARHGVARPAFADEAVGVVQGGGPALLPYGLGRSYGDSCLNAGGTLVDTRGLDRWIRFDDATGVAEVEAGVTLADLLARLHAAATPDGAWFLPVTPGTKWVTVGGAIANDVHGKNHHLAGCFGNHVLRLRLLRSDGMHECSPTQEPELFAATIGGLGLTGLVLSASVQLKRVPSLELEVEDLRYGSLDQFHRLSEESADWEYTVAWVDTLARGTALGRGVFTRARHAPGRRPVPPPRIQPRLGMPIDLPGAVMNPLSVRAFNAVYWRRAPFVPRRRLSHYEPVFYPLDAIRDWNRMYGRRGFYQYQCVVPPGTARDAVAALLRAVSDTGESSFLTTLKTLGNRASPGMLSFPMPGTTLALDIPNRGPRTHALLDRLDRITADAGGRIYPAKDGRVSARLFQQGYPAWREFARHVDPRFSSGFWRRVSAPVAAAA